MTDCERECREYVSRLLSPTEVGKQIGVSMQMVSQYGRRLGLGIMVAGGRLYPPEDVREIERYRASRKYKKGATPRARAEEIEETTRPRTEITMSQSYQDAIRKLRGERA